MCNDIGCPDGYEPIANAWEVECLGGECKVKQCCDAMCACYACPDNFVPIEGAADVFCNGGVCTTQQCCDHHEDGQGDEALGSDEVSPPPAPPTPPATPTPSPTFALFAPAPSSASASFCKGFECPAGYTIMDGVDLVECEKDVCDKDECCVSDGEMPEEDDYAYCSMVQCPEETHHPVEDADTKPCKVIDDSTAPAPTPRQDDDSSWMSGGSYEFVDYDDYDGYIADDDFVVLVVGGDGDGTRESVYEHGTYSYSYDFDAEEDEEEYCDHSTCCEEKDYGLWGRE